MRRLAVLALGLAMGALAGSAWADEVITVTLGKHHPLKLDRRAAAVFIGKPEIVDYVGFRSDHFFLLGQALGETSLLILDSRDKEILKAHVVVVPETDRHVTINRGGKNMKDGIAEETLSCGERCSSVSVSGTSAAKPGAGDSGSGNGDMGGPATTESGSPAGNAAKELSGSKSR
ncbi:MAG: pilus assembly protein N-terminal domain-containing protein [Rhodospirillales bacterium]|nr:pilus assembly protein N-terminal domain-containing protein [Rhodospirillales bacterium]